MSFLQSDAAGADVALAAPVVVPGAELAELAGDPEALASSSIRCNKRELAVVIGVSVPTLDNWLLRYPDLPYVQRGTNGKEWLFDPVAVRAWRSGIAAAEAEVEARRREEIAQLGLPLEGAGDAGGAALKPAERLAHVKALAAEDKLAIERKFLTLTSDVRKAVQNGLAAWSRAEFAALRQAAARANIPDVVTRELESAIREARVVFLEAVKDLIREGGGGDGGNRDLFGAP